jgi:hypothetical protein
MDNKQLAKTVLDELKKLTTKLNTVISKLRTPREKDNTRVNPQDASGQENDAADRQFALTPKVPPSPTYRKQTDKPWYKTTSGWKTLLEMIAIPFAIGYAIVTYWQWRDLRYNFEVDQRSWVKIGCPWPPLNGTQPVTVNAELTNFGKSPVTGLYGEGALEVIDAKNGPSFSLQQRHSHHSEAQLFPGDKSTFPINLFDPSSKQQRAFTPSRD